MRKIIKKMAYKTPCRLLGCNILLTAIVAKAAMQVGIAVQTNFFGAFWLVGHSKNFLKIRLNSCVGHADAR